MAKKQSSAAARKKPVAKSAAPKSGTAATEPGPPEKAHNIVVTLANNAVSDADKVSRLLKKAGMTIEMQLDGIGQFIGTVADNSLTRLSNIKGVAGVEQLGEVHVPPNPRDPQ